MQQGMDDNRKTSSQILPIVVAAFAGATLAIACERPDSRMAAAEDLAVAAKTSPPPAPAATPGPPAAAPTPVPASVPREAITDPAITSRINAAIQTDPAMSGADISVNTDRGVVILAGTVKSHEQTGVASAHAQRQDGVMRVDSHLSVKEP